MQCQRCESEQLIHISGWCKYSEQDLAYPQSSWTTRGHNIEIDSCLNCGQVQGKFDPKPIEQDIKVAMDERGDWIFLAPFPF